MQKTFFIISGLPGAGKWTVAVYLSEKYHIPHFSTWDIFRDIFRQFGIPETRENFSHFIATMKATFWEDIIARGIETRIWFFNWDSLIVEWVRHPSVLDMIRSKWNVKIIYIDTEWEKRYERMRERWEKQNESSMSYQEFLDQDWLSSEKNLSFIRELADILIENNGTKEELSHKIDLIKSFL